MAKLQSDTLLEIAEKLSDLTVLAEMSEVLTPGNELECSLSVYDPDSDDVTAISIPWMDMLVFAHGRAAAIEAELSAVGIEIEPDFVGSRDAAEPEPDGGGAVAD